MNSEAFRAILQLAVLLPLAAGCDLLPKGPTVDVRRQHDLYGRVALVPLTQKGLPYRAFDGRNRHGQAITSMAVEILSNALRDRGVAVEDPRRLQSRIERLDLDAAPLDEVARKAQCDWLVTGELEAFSLRDPGAVNVFRGQAAMKVTVYEVKPDRPVIHSLVARYPLQDFGGFQAGGMDTDENQIRSQLLKACALQVAWLFIDHEQPREWRH